MAKVLVLYHSTYGHIETMAYAVAEGAKSAGADVVVKRVPETVPEEIAKASHFKLDQAAPIATPEELADYDAIIFGAWHTLRHSGFADARLHRPDRRSVDEGCPYWQGWFRVHIVCYTARRSGIHHSWLPANVVPPWHDRRWPAIRVPGPDGRGRSQGRLALWCLHHHRRQRFAHAFGNRIGGSPLPGRACCQDRCQAGCVIKRKRSILFRKRDCFGHEKERDITRCRALLLLASA